MRMQTVLQKYELYKERELNIWNKVFWAYIMLTIMQKGKKLQKYNTINTM